MKEEISDLKSQMALLAAENVSQHSFLYAIFINFFFMIKIIVQFSLLNYMLFFQEELRSKGRPEEKKGELLDQFDDYLDKLKKKHQQELQQLTKK